MDEKTTGDALDRAHKIHVMGLCGSAMGTFAGMLKTRGYEVRGSDAGGYPPMSDQLEDWGIPLMVGYDAANLEWRPDLVIVGNVIRRSNPEAVAMRAQGLPHLSFPAAFAQAFLTENRPVVLTGTHGKTTTTSLVAWLLECGQLDPTVLVGGVPLNFGRSFKLGKGKHVVVEGDEYDTAYFDKVPKFLHYRPQVGVITNIEFDHADIYDSVEAIETEFVRFSALLPESGRLIVWAGCERALRAASGAACGVETYGVEQGFWRATALVETPEATHFTLMRGDEEVGRFETPLFGHHNIQNAVAAAAVAIGEGVAAESLAVGLQSFRNVKKRHELKGIAGGVTVLDDFAHHPTAVAATVSAVVRRFTGQRVWCCFEVESNTSRRRVFQNDYPPAFDGAHSVVFCKPFAKADNLAPEDRIQLDVVVEKIRRRGPEAHLIAEVDDIVAYLLAGLEPGDVVLAMSGRHFYGLHDKLLSALAAT